MAWFVGQSLFIVGATFLLGLFVGWLLWGVLWRQRWSDQSTAADHDLAQPGLEQHGPAELGPAQYGHPQYDLAPHEQARYELAQYERAQYEQAQYDRARYERAHDQRAHDQRHFEHRPFDSRQYAPEANQESYPDNEFYPEPEYYPEVDPRESPLRAIPSQAVPLPADDLERIEGIGPRMAGALWHAGIRTYAQLAMADDSELRSAIAARGMRFAPSLSTWSVQARLLADGDENGFADLTRRLVASRNGAGRDNATRDSATRDSATRDSATRDSAARDNAARDSAAPESAAREGTVRSEGRR